MYLKKEEYNVLISKIKLEALGLGPDETLSTTCPLCQGGRSRDKSFSITRVYNGLLYHCFRDSCGIKGFLGSDKLQYSEKKKKPFKAKYLDRPLKPLSESLFKWISMRYNIRPDILKLHNWKYDYFQDRIAMPIYNIHGRRVGYTCKAIKKDVTPKTIEYWEVESPKINVPINRHEKGKCILVEDTISSLSLLPCYNSIALLGTNMDYNTASIIANTFPNIVIALDADTWENKEVPTGIKLRNKYHLLFDSIEVLRITADPKDMTNDQKIEEIFSKI